MIDKHLDTPPGKPGKIRTYTGRLVDPFNLTDEDIIVEDIAHSLAQQCRFTGHTRRFYSIAEHCIVVASFLMNRGLGHKVVLGGLIHDAGEVYFGDMAGPTKRRSVMDGYDKAEHIAADIITTKFCGTFTEDEKQLIKRADADAYHVERKTLIRPGFLEDYESDYWPLGLQSIADIKLTYLRTFYNLYQQF